MFELAGLGLGAIGTIGKMFARGRANRDINKLISQDPIYTENPIAAQRLGLAKTLLNARMPGASQAENNIYQNQANTISNINRNATDSSQALALASGAQGQTNNAFQQLGSQEAQDYQRRYNNLVGAQEGEINEGDKVFQDQTRRFGDLTQFRGAQASNRAANWGDISNFGFGIADFGASGGGDKLSGLFGKKQSTSQYI